MLKSRPLVFSLLLFTLSLFCVPTASADSTWTLNNVTFSLVSCCGGGATGTATGFFVDPSSGTSNSATLTSWDITTTDTGGNSIYGASFDWNPSDSTAFLETDGAGNVGIGLETTANCAPAGDGFTPCRTMGLFTASTLLNPASTPIAQDSNFGLEAVWTNCTGPGFSSCNETARSYNSGGFLTTNFVATPEPATLTLIGLGLGLVGISRKRARKE